MLAQIDDLLFEAGTDKSKILSATIYLPDIGDFAAMNAVWEKWVVPGQTPARATVEAKLAAPEYSVEIQVDRRDADPARDAPPMPTPIRRRQGRRSPPRRGATSRRRPATPRRCR